MPPETPAGIEHVIQYFQDQGFNVKHKDDKSCSGSKTEIIEGYSVNMSLYAHAGKILNVQLMPYFNNAVSLNLDVLLKADDPEYKSLSDKLKGKDKSEQAEILIQWLAENLKTKHDKILQLAGKDFDNGLGVAFCVTYEGHDPHVVYTKATQHLRDCILAGKAPLITQSGGCIRYICQ